MSKGRNGYRVWPDHFEETSFPAALLMLIGFCAIVGVIGLLGMTWLFPVCGRILWRIPMTEGDHEALALEPLRETLRTTHITALIPTHNDSAGLALTLRSIANAVERARRLIPGLEVSVLVGIDGGDDDSAVVAHSYGAAPFVSRRNRGKWRTLDALVSKVTASDWIALVDSGIVWENDLLLKISPYLSQRRIIGIAPSYVNSVGGTLERTLWALERYLKSMESAVGGPVSIHGATVMYRREELVTTFKELRRKRWLNDDVVVPLTLRALFPDKVIRYLPHVCVHDSSRPVSSREFVRRRRLMAGNIQWIRTLLPRTFRRSSLVTAVACRRVFRVFWAYWLGFLCVALVGFLIQSDLPPWLSVFALLTTGAAAMLCLRAHLTSVPRIFRTMASSAWASFLAPLYLFNYKLVRGAPWR